MKYLLLITLILVNSVAAAQDGLVGPTSQGTVGIFIVIPPKPIPDEVTEDNPTPWAERCDEANTECDITELADNNIEVIVKPI